MSTQPDTQPPAPPQEAIPQWLLSRKRRRHKGGKRIRSCTSDRNKAPPTTDLNYISCESEWAHDNGHTAIESWNENAWHAGFNSAVKSSADALLMQETRLLEADLCKRAEDAAMRSGWQGTINAANRTDNGGTSAGVGILAKKHIGMKYDSVVIQKKFQPGMPMPGLVWAGREGCM